MNLALLSSSQDTYLLPLFNALHAMHALSFIIVNKSNTSAQQFAKQHNIPFLVINPEDFTSREKEHAFLAETLKKKHIDYAFFIAFNEILTSNLTLVFPNKLINLHPSLLPAFPGLFEEKLYQTILANHPEQSGITFHFIDEGIDTGEIIAQHAFSLSENESLPSLKEKVVQNAIPLLAEVFQKIK